MAMARSTWRVGGLVGALAAAAAAQPDFTAINRPTVAPIQLSLSYDHTYRLREDVADQPGGMAMMQHDLSLAMPLWHDERQAVSLHAGVRALDLNTDARLRDWDDLLDGHWQDFDAALPGELYDVRLGATYRRKLANDWIVGGSLTLGSASDRPFASAEEWVVNATGFARVPHGERNAWLLMLNVANNREFLPGVPIPGVAYAWSPDQKLATLLGIPFCWARYQPIDGLTLQGAYFIPRTVHAKISYQIVEPLELFAAFDWDSQRYLRSGRHDEDDRLFFYEKRVTGGLRWRIAKGVHLDAYAGYGFDRLFFEGEGYSDRGDRRIDIDDGPFVGLRAVVRF